MEGPSGTEAVPRIVMEGPSGTEAVPRIVIEGPSGAEAVPRIVMEGPSGTEAVPRIVTEGPSGTEAVPRIVMEGPSGTEAVPRIVTEGPSGTEAVPRIVIKGPSRNEVVPRWYRAHCNRRSDPTQIVTAKTLYSALQGKIGMLTLRWNRDPGGGLALLATNIKDASSKPQQYLFKTPSFTTCIKQRRQIKRNKVSLP